MFRRFRSVTTASVASGASEAEDCLPTRGSWKTRKGNHRRIEGAERFELERPDVASPDRFRKISGALGADQESDGRGSMILTDPINLCNLIEAGVGSFEANALRSEAPQAVEFLLKIGALMPGQLARVLTCCACHNDHPVHLEYDSTTRRHWHFCLEAGHVTVEGDAIVTLSVGPDWLLEWIVKELPIKPPVRRRTLMPRLAWHLGDASVGETELTVVLAVGTSARRNLDALANAICSVPPAKLGLVITTSLAPPRWLRLPHGYQFLGVREIAHAMNDRLAIDKNKLLRWIKGSRKGLDKPARLRAGRPSEADLVKYIFRDRRARNLPLITQRAEARAIRAEIASQYPDHELPQVKTIEAHLRKSSE
jgi:hypothetical protein